MSSSRRVLVTFLLLAAVVVHGFRSALPERRKEYHLAERTTKAAARTITRSSISRLGAKKTKTSAVAATTSRQNRVASLQKWATDVAQIQISPQLKLQQASESSGLGWFAASAITDKNALVLTVPSSVALTVECPGDGPDDSAVASMVRNSSSKSSKLSDFPWYVQMAVYLHKLDRVDDTKQDISYRPWLDSLPRQFTTPLHWTSSEDAADGAPLLRELLQYDHLVDAVQRQRETWKRHYDNLALPGMAWEDFVWGCECARSRAFSGAYTGSAFNPAVYAFTLLLVTVYVGLQLGTLEQAANGAAIVLCFSVLKDFVVPKLFKTKRYVISPVIDMANHKSVGAAGDVSFEYFGNAYSLALQSSVGAGKEIFISYGSRSNDQLLQYYGFVEVDNPHDVYVMPPLRNWDIGALEKACGRQFSPGRLEKLDRAGLLGSRDTAKSTSNNSSDDEDGKEGEATNSGGGVVLTRTGGIDPAVLQALRALVSTDEEWQAAGEAIGNFVEENSGGSDNERCARLVAQTAIEMELASKMTTIAQDQDLLQQMEGIKSLDASQEEKLAVLFRIEKKKLLRETMEKLR